MSAFKKVAVALGLVVVALSFAALPAGASGSGTVNPNPVAVTSGQTTATVTVNWSGLANPGHKLFLTQCKKLESDPTFVFASDCSNLSEILVNASANPGGASSVQFTVFRGENPDGDSGWGCFDASDPAVAGVTAFTTCNIRVTEDAESNTSTDFSIPFTFASTGGGALPETSTVVLLPVTAGVVLTAAWFLQRRRNRVVV